MSLEDVPQKMQFLGTIKSWQVWTHGAKMQNNGNSPQNRPSPAQNSSESKFSWIFQQPMDRDKYACMVVCAKSFLGKSSCVSKIPRGKQENPRITVSVFLCTFKLTAWLLKQIQHLLHCYTLGDEHPSLLMWW